MKSFNQFILEKKNPKKDSSGPLSADEKKSIKSNKEKISRLTISGEEESKKISDELKKSDTKGDTPTNKKNRPKRKGRTSLLGDIPKSKRKVQSNADDIVNKRVNQAKNTAPGDVFSTKKQTTRPNIDQPGLVRDPKTGETLTYGKNSQSDPSPKKPSQSSNTYFSDLDDSTAKKYPKTDDSKFTSENKPEPKKPESKALERPTKKPPTEKPSTSSLPSESKPKPARKYTRAQKARLTGQAEKILKKIKSAKKLETRMAKAIDKSNKPGTYSDKVNQVIKAKPLKGTPKPEVIKQAEVSKELKKKSETAQQKRDKVQREKSRTKIKTTLKPTSTSGGSGSGKTAINNLTRKDPMPDVKSSGPSKRSGYSIKNDLEALKRKTKTSSTSTPPKTKPISGRTGFGAPPGVDRITPPPTRRPIITPPPSPPTGGGGNIDPPDETKGPKNKKTKKQSWKKFRKNLMKKVFGKKGRKIPITGGDLIYPAFTGYGAFSRQKQQGASNTRATTVGVARGGLDFAAAAVAYRRMPGPAWLKSLAATGAVVTSGTVGRSLENKLPLTKVEKAKIKNAEDKKKEAEKLKNQRKNQSFGLFGGQQKVKPYEPKYGYVDFGFNPTGGTKRGNSSK